METGRTIIRCCTYMFSAVCMAGGLYLAARSAMGIVHGRTAVQWPTVPATIESCKLETWFDEDGEGYSVDLAYNYTVDGTAYTAHGVHPALDSGDMEAKDVYDKLKDAKVVLAHYNPDRPSEAYVATGSFVKPWEKFFAALVVFFFGLLFLLMVHCALSAESEYADRLVVIR